MIIKNLNLIFFNLNMSFKKGDFRHDFKVSCPFNINHRMPVSRLLYHITSNC